MKKESQKYSLHSAFTLLELVFVIVIIGILTTFLLQENKRNITYEAATQLVSHIRYTQHLAMVDDKFSANDNVWYKKRWQIIFGTSVDTDNKIAYSIFSDNASDADDAKPNLSELARDPMNPEMYLSGGYSGILNTLDDYQANKKMNLGLSYGISTIEFSGGCLSGTKRISFDHLGRPIRDSLATYDQSYHTSTGTGTTNRLIQDACIIKLINPDEGNATIRIEPETGYAYVVI